jgi:hypothetical protein
MRVILSKQLPSLSLEPSDSAKKAKARSIKSLKDKMSRLREAKADYLKGYSRKMEQLKKQQERIK